MTPSICVLIAPFADVCCHPKPFKIQIEKNNEPKYISIERKSNINKNVDFNMKKKKEKIKNSVYIGNTVRKVMNGTKVDQHTQT